MATQKTVVLITGANSGIGFETAVAVAATSSDYHVLVGCRSTEKGQLAIKEMEKKNPKGSLSLLQIDVTDEETITKAVATVEKEFGKVDVLINNAGIAPETDTSLGNLMRRILETNTIGPAVVTENFLPLLKKSSSGGARLIYVSSELGSKALREGKTHWSWPVEFMPYRVSKAALNMLIAYQFVDFEKFGIKVFGVCPGYVVTNLGGGGEEAQQARVARGAGSAEVSGQTILAIIDGRRDKDVGMVVHKDGVYPW